MVFMPDILGIAVCLYLLPSLLLSVGAVYTSYGDSSTEEFRCPQHWYQYYQSCYRFQKSPLKSYWDAKKICQAYSDDNSVDLVSIGTFEEHDFLVHTLDVVDPHRYHTWYVGAHQQSAQYWTNADGSQLVNIENAFMPEDLNQIDPATLYGRDYLAFNFSRRLMMRWLYQPVYGEEPLVYICEAHIQSVQHLRVDEERSITYGIEITDPKRIPKGPYFIRQPVDVVYDLSASYDVSLNSLAGGYPTPTYRWYREEYRNDKLVAIEIDALREPRYTISGGSLIIHDAQQNLDRATYHCKATNAYGTIISESIQLNFGFILEFVLKRSPQYGEKNWGKSVYCDPPNHFPSVRYQWSREYFPNFVEEDVRVFVSYDGAIYFSAMEIADNGNYSCSVQSEFSTSGRNGPFFPIIVNPSSSYQQLKFPNNFPKAFPDAPTVGSEVRLECIAFGYPVPSYNWTRKGGALPRKSYLSNYDRVLIISNVQVEDQGEYVCRAFNDRASTQNSVILDIQAEPNFTIPLNDRNVDSRGQLVWMCEAFGIPDVNYTWWRNGRQLVMGYLEPEDRGRIRIQDNILTINQLDQDRDPGMYQCRASNSLKTKYSSAQLRVLAFAPTFKKDPLESEMYAAERNNVTIKCNPEAAPRPKFIWRRDGNVLGSGGHRRILDNGNLVISPVSRDDDGIYTCSASNELGMDESSGRLIVLRGPEWIQDLQQQMVTTIGSYFTLNCEAVIDDMLDGAYIWLHNGIRIQDEDVIRSNNRMLIQDGYLTINNMTQTDAGTYECRMISAVGQISSRTEVLVKGPPSPPAGVQVAIQRRSVILQWIDGNSYGAPIHAYSISGRTNWNSTWRDLGHVSVGYYNIKDVDRYTGRKEVTMEDVLTPWSIYEFRVAAWNSFGMGPPSAPSPRHSTPPDRPYISPRNIGGGGGNVGDLTITWSPLRSDEQNAEGIFYKVFWKRKTVDTEYQSTDLRDHGNTDLAVVPVGLQYYYTECVVKVQAINSVGAGPISEEVTVFSAEDMPQVAPQLVIATSYNSTALNVSWDAIELIREKIRGKLIGHRIKYWPEASREETAIYYLSRSVNPWALIVGLSPDTYYFVKAMAFNSAGEGPESERFLERTYRKAPQKPPSSVFVSAVNPFMVKVVWRYVQPSIEEEPLMGYKIRVWDFDRDLSTANDTIVPVREKLEAYVGNLHPGKTYTLRVLAYSLGGDGRMSSPAISFRMGTYKAT